MSGWWLLDGVGVAEPLFVMISNSKLVAVATAKFVVLNKFAMDLNPVLRNALTAFLHPTRWRSSDSSIRANRGCLSTSFSEPPLMIWPPLSQRDSRTAGLFQRRRKDQLEKASIGLFLMSLSRGGIECRDNGVQNGLFG